MKKTLELIEKIKSKLHPILGTKPDIVIMHQTDALILEASWYCVETYRLSRAYSKSEIINIVDDEILIDGFIHECNRMADTVEN